jgi:16S rRNA (cytidine1402-2'-O)-methyltransferase
MGNLYVISTPIGNLEDITLRAIRILGEVSAVLAEDTRRTGILLRHLGLTTPLLSYHQHNEEARSREALGRLGEGEDLALVSDAGTPLVSDPGERLTARVLDAGHRVVPIPGPSAVLAALVASGLPALPFTFLGFRHPGRAASGRRSWSGWWTPGRPWSSSSPRSGHRPSWGNWRPRRIRSEGAW